MNPLWLLALPLALVLILLFRRRAQQDRADQSNLDTLYTQLNDAVLEVSQLVALNCPRNTDAHKAVIEAAKCLVFPKVGPHTIVTASMIEARYREGFRHLAQARSMSSGIR